MGMVPPTEFRDGDTLEPWHLNFIFRFIARWMKFDAAPPLSFGNNGNSPPHLSWTGIDELVPVVFDSGITAGSYTAPSTATATLLIESGDGPAFTETGANTVTVQNVYTTAVGTGKVGWCKWRGPYLYLIVGDC
jgi:hypothetical protein